MNTIRRVRPVHHYVAIVTAAGLAVLVGVLSAGLRSYDVHRPELVFLFAPFMVAAELWPIRVRRGETEEEIGVSTTFAFALLLVCGLAAATVALVVASLVGDTSRRKPLWKSAFNVAQLTLSLVSAAGALWFIGNTALVTPDRVRSSQLPAIVFGAVVFFLVNDVLAGTAIALSTRQRVRSFLRRDFWFQAGTTGVLLSLAPVVVSAANNTAMLVPLLILPIAAVHKCASILLTRDYEAAHDPLTSLANRMLFRQQVIEALAVVGKSGAHVAVMLIDLDRFKEVNDTLGHHIGDVLLQQIGPRLEGVLRAGDTVARLGGDEFAVLVHEVPDEAAAMEVADRMLEALEQPFSLPDVVVDVDASIGIAIGPEHGTDVDQLLQRADVAMYLAKESRSGYQVYAFERDPYSPKRLTLLHEMRQALELEQFVCYYQPKADLATGAIVGVEALIRWQHPEHGLLAPDMFVPIAERSGLSRPMTLYVLEHSLGQLRKWHDQGCRIGMAVNLTLRNLHDPAFPLDVRRLLERFDIPPRFLQLEITENIVMADPVRVLGVLKGLRDLGCQLALDDFGTGYSSLQHLKKLPVNELKIDKSFVMNMASDDSDAVIVKSTIDLARNLRLRTVAEGVEDLAAWDVLAGMGCEVAQGFYLSRPVPAAELTRWLRTHQLTKVV